jgi:5-formyltetrahydrofolate cyclo-ligase
MTKAEHRKFMKSVLRAIPTAQRQAQSRAACRRMAETPEFLAARSVMLYLPMPGELDIQSLAAAVTESSRQLLLPQVDWEQLQMTPVVVPRLEAYYESQLPMVPQPAGGKPFPIADIDLIVVPGLAFSPEGGRLGRGKGFYDRFLSRPGLSAWRAAVAFNEQLQPAIPVERHDVPMQMIVTADGIWRPSRVR